MQVSFSLEPEKIAAKISGGELTAILEMAAHKTTTEQKVLILQAIFADLYTTKTVILPMETLKTLAGAFLPLCLSDAEQLFELATEAIKDEMSTEQIKEA